MFAERDGDVGGFAGEDVQNAGGDVYRQGAPAHTAGCVTVFDPEADLEIRNLYFIIGIRRIHRTDNIKLSCRTIHCHTADIDARRITQPARLPNGINNTTL